MLDTLRANSRSVLTYVLFAIIIVVFVVSFGPGSRGCTSGGRAATWAAKVNGTTLSPGEFEGQYGNLARMYQQGGVELNPAQRLQLRQMALEQVVQRELLEQEARRQGIVVTDDEVSHAVKQIPGFQTDGRFDYEAYKRAVSGAYGSPAKFEERLRGDLAYTKMLALVRDTIRVGDDDVKDAWLAENDKAELEFARFPLALARAEVKPTDAQVKEFQAQSAQRIAQYYKDNAARFDRKKQVKARHILVRVAPNASSEQDAAAKKKIEDAAARVKKGEDFAKVAKELSEDPGSKDQGGELGFFGEGVMAKPFEEAAFKLKKGEVSDPVRTQFGWHVIQAEDVKEPEKLSEAQAAPEIARELLQEDLAKKLVETRAQETLKKLQAGKSLAEALPAEAKKGVEPVKVGGQVVKPETTGPFGAGTSPNIPKIGPAPELFADTLKANAGQVLPRVYDTAGGPVVARVKDRQRADPAKFAEKKAEVEARLRTARESQIEQAWVKALKDKAKIELNGALVRGEVTAAPAELD